MKGKDVIKFIKENKLEEIEIMITASVNNESNAREIKDIHIEADGLTAFIDIGNIHYCNKQTRELKCILKSCANPMKDACDGCYWLQ